ncbi:RsmF rRNA methyltransferase first C-terminal domain-containing protein [Paenibacillus sp. GD4]|uniref:RsmF rRNA methyltransferase first C-terminal domain-containing protein n=1 Tax=Paenibacillus sp. GD4 TaxID=3068890 RepID=UPI00279689AD|nr:RsmF rRNA methyltransferase first C-terminal domain-containing protein [Paenibacillus sp. GD4]MDQ1909749.1 RsmF rRNA methyltransferase first C-terminal domain-containing protein [Paenibacillus sp. GD4]
MHSTNEVTQITLPQAYQEQMRRLLGGESDAFLATYGHPRTQGLRLNPLKSAEAAVELMKERFGLEPVPWCENGYYYEEESRPGKHPYHAGGLYYIQEPSAMSAVELLSPQPGELVLDLAGAPGGKSTQIGGKLRGEGLLIANEIHPVRAKSLAENIERMGIANAVVVNAAPDQLAERFPSFFDRIMVDAPCSGEGMFRKDPEAIQEWSPEHVAMCAARQLDILPAAITMLKPGGRLGYSTCTFNEQENEQVIEALLKQFPQLVLERTERIWPHVHRGEGHFVAVLRLAGEPPEVIPADEGKERPARGKRGAARPEEAAMKLFQAFAEACLSKEFSLAAGEPLLFGDQLYWLPAPAGSGFGAASLKGLKVLRPGLHLAEVKKDRIEPAHALALSLHSASSLAKQVLPLRESSPETTQYLRGEQLESGKQGQGWIIVAVDDVPLGWGKQTGTQVKNHYPKGLRRMS